jgi:acyl-CoA thioesterase I
MTGGRVLVVGNSVSQPLADGVAAYPQRLEALAGQRCTIQTLIRGGATLDDFDAEVISAIETFNPDVVVLQVGINECAPRPLGRSGRARLARLRPLWLRQRVIAFLHRYRSQIIKLRGVKQLTSAEDFAAAVQRVISAARRRGSVTLILPITRIPAAAEVRTPFTNREVARYNAVLASLADDSVRWVSEAELFDQAVPEDFCAGPQTVHLAASAHETLARFIAEWLDAACMYGAQRKGAVKR